MWEKKDKKHLGEQQQWNLEIYVTCNSMQFNLINNFILCKYYFPRFQFYYYHHHQLDMAN